MIFQSKCYGIHEIIKDSIAYPPLLYMKPCIVPHFSYQIWAWARENLTLFHSVQSDQHLCYSLPGKYMMVHLGFGELNVNINNSKNSFTI